MSREKKGQGRGRGKRGMRGGEWDNGENKKET